jgi:hypothetical protein
MLRLTLRTLLAYLDDTLDAAQAKDIGKKVAESEFAQETVERIKTVTRRRRLSAPPLEADDYSLDPNTIAEYLDNVLPPDQVTELERAALEQDVRLAEVAACHQILTLVLGEPAKVPPTARTRMYGVVKGPEAIPYRKPAAASTPVAGKVAPAEVDEFAEPEEDLLHTFLGPRSAAWLVGLLVATALLVAAVWLAIPPAPPQPNQGYIAVAAAPRTDIPNLGPAIPGRKPDEVVGRKPDEGDGVVPPPPIFTGDPELGPPPRVIGEPTLEEIKVPDTERRVIAVHDSPMQPLLYRKRETMRWDRPDTNDPKLSSTDTLVALPGFHPEVHLESGVRVQLWGNVPEVLNLPLAESRVTLHVPARGADADLTLHGGRIFVSAPKAGRPVLVRVRFLDEIWDVTLNDGGTEVGIDRIGEPSRGKLFDLDVPEAPRAIVYLGVLSGTASVRSGFHLSGDLLTGTGWKWDNKGGRPGPIPKDDPDAPAGLVNRWSKTVPNTPAAKDVAAAVAEMARRVGMGQGPFDVDFDATLKEPREAVGRQVLSTWMLGSVDSLSYLIDALEADSAAVRDAAAKALRHWCAQAPDREERFAEVLAGKAGFSDAQRANLQSLVRQSDRPAAEVADRLFDLLTHEKLAVRELARVQLARLDPAGARESNYDSASDRRGNQVTLWKASLRKRMKVKE